MAERISLPFNLENVFISISLDISNIKAEEDSDTNKSENFNTNI